MKWKKWLDNWDMTGLKINLKFLEMEFAPREPDKNAAWELYVELLTRVATQPLSASGGEEEAALASIHSLFPLTRRILRQHGRDCQEFAKIAIVILNQVVRPFTTKWHKAQSLDTEEEGQVFRAELEAVRRQLVQYTGMLGEMAGSIQDLRHLEAGDADEARTGNSDDDDPGTL